MTIAGGAVIVGAAGVMGGGVWPKPPMEMIMAPIGVEVGTTCPEDTVI